MIGSNMASELFSVEQVAQRLGLHVKTIRGYVREGRLKATRIGKQYRIARADLEAFTGQSAGDLAPVRRTRRADVSSIVDIDAISRESVMRIANALGAAAKSRPESDPPVRIDTIYDEERAHLKVIVTGTLSTGAILLQFLTALLEGTSP
jgi:excisionase family DNA binding protein